jgi:hypothetical protein
VSAIRKDQDRQRLRELLLAGAASKPTKAVDQDYFESLRRPGLLGGQISVPEDFDRMGEAEIAALFGLAD